MKRFQKVLSLTLAILLVMAMLPSGMVAAAADVLYEVLLEPSVGGYLNSNTYGNVAVVRENIYYVPDAGGQEYWRPTRLIEYTGTGSGYRYLTKYYKNIGEFSAQGYAVAENFNDEWGIIDSSGNPLTDFKYTYAYSVSDDGYAVMASDDTWTPDVLLNLNNHAETQISQEWATYFSSGYTCVEIYNESNQNSTYHYEKADGSWPFSTTYDYAGNFSYGYAGVRTVGEAVYQIINTQGRAVLSIPAGYWPDGGISKEGIFAVTDGNRIGYMDVTGNWIVSCQYSIGRMFQNGYAVVWDSNYNQGIIDTKGQTIIPFGTFYNLSNASNTDLVWNTGENLTILRINACAEPAPTGLAQWTKLYPANGATDVGYKADGPEHYQITFDRKIANDGALANVDLTSNGAFAIYRASDDALIYKPSQYARSDFKIVYKSENILSITPVNNHTLLEPGTEYYITMGEGFVNFADGSTNQAINKGDWVFSTKLFEKEGEFKYLSKDGYDTKYRYSYSDSYFEGLSNKYNHELANMSISLALSAFNSASSMASEYKDTTAAKNVRALLSDINFDEKSIDTSSYEGKPQKDTIGVAFGKKEVSYGSGDYTLVAVAIRGAGYEAEWGGNLTVGRNGNHAGFQAAADSVLSGLKEYIKSQEISGDLKIWITGYSRAAATANLVAAALDDGELFSGINPVSRSSVSLKRTDVYAYTFETPMATTNSNSSAYDNIFNIVNPIDPVPKVAPEGWDFTRYGVTYYMPTSEELTFNEYRNIILRVNTEYAKIIKVIPGSSESYIKALSNQGTVLNNFLNYLSVKLPRNTYSPGYEDLIAPIIAEVTNSGKTDAEAIASIVLEFCVRHPKEAKTIIDALEDAVGSKVFWFVVAEQGFEQLYQMLGWEGTTATEVVALLFDTITQSHIPEVTLAWMRTINGADEYGSGMTRKLYINCPVNVSVYDSSNQLVAQIIDDEPQLIDDSLIGTYVDGSGQKIIVLPNNEKYRIVLTATDNGTVTYTATEYSLDTGNSERVVSYYEVEVINGDELTAIAENLSEVSFAEYPFYLNDSRESLEPTINQIGDDVTEYTVTVSVLGNGKAFGGGSYISGEFSHMEAEPNDGERFLGWYVGNSLISEELEYRFLVDTSYDVIARFTTNINQGSDGYPHVPDTPSTPSGSGGYYDGSSSVSGNPNYQITVPTTSNGTVTVTPKSAASGDKVTIIATPNEGYITSSVTAADRDGKGISVTDNGDGTYTFAMPASQVTVSVLFTSIETTSPVPDAPDETSWVNPFTDVAADEWYYDAVRFVSENSLMNGIDNNLFAPNANLSRAQLAQILYNKESRPAVNSDNIFSDVAMGEWYTDAITWAAANNIVGGYGNGLFGPDDNITREQLAVMLWRYTGEPVANVEVAFNDADQISDFAQAAIRWAVENGILNGKDGNMLDPQGFATRAEVAQMLKNYLDN